jgi:hypothetical protein
MLTPGCSRWQLDVSATYRFTPHAQLKLQHGFSAKPLAPTMRIICSLRNLRSRF